MGSSPFPPVPPSVGAVRRDEGVPGPAVSMVLAKDRVRWIQAEFGGKVKLGQTKDEFVAGIKACKDRKVTYKLNKLWKDTGGPDILPRSIEQRAIGLFEAMVKLDQSHGDLNDLGAEDGSLPDCVQNFYSVRSKGHMYLTISFTLSITGALFYAWCNWLGSE